jgi:hypothetical protein
MPRMRRVHRIRPHRVAAAVAAERTASFRIPESNFEVNAMNTKLKLLVAALAINLSAIAGVHAADAAQKTFASPEAAGQALVAAARADDESALTSILGATWKDRMSSGDAADDKAALDAFVAKYDRMNRWATMTDGSRVLDVGADNYPYPVPLAKVGNAWRFDSAAGEREIAVRRIGSNELLAIDAVNVMADAQEAYLDGQREGAVKKYAKSIVSTNGKHDGLYWTALDQENQSPLAALDTIVDDSAALRDPLVVDGYTYRVLTQQGASAPGGAKSYMKDGELTDGFAILATPSTYGKSGVMSFMLNRDGVVYQKDLGDETLTVSNNITAYDPGDGWTPVE